jgi:hypothetical protein
MDRETLRKIVGDPARMVVQNRDERKKKLEMQQNILASPAAINRFIKNREHNKRIDEMRRAKKANKAKRK